MSTHRHIDRICAAAVAFTLLLTLLFMSGDALGIQTASSAMGYEAKLFDTSRVHTIDILMDDWDSFIETCENEEYAACSVVIDNEACKNVGIRAKGNTSLSTVSQLGSDRYSFKIEFDQYDSGKTYYGLDKLCLNNLIQDNTMMKDYLTYRLMAAFGANAPLCSYVYVTVNGEDWGLYLAVEGVEDAFLQRNYGRDHGELYKPDSTGFGAGLDGVSGFIFDTSDFNNFAHGGGWPGNMQLPEQGNMPEGFEPSAPAGQGPASNGDENAPQQDFDPSARFGGQFPGQDGGAPPEGFDPSAIFGYGGTGGPAGGGMGSGDVKLQYAGDDPDSYSNIFNSAKTNVSEADQARLIRALKELSEGDADSALDIGQVLRYFVVHNFVVNGDSYTGSMVHNYYLYEEDGQLSMIPWDYNLAFGTFQGSDASGAVNDPIDSPLSVTGNGDRPMADWIFSSGEYTQLYHQYFQQFLDSVDCAAIIEHAYALTAPYVEKDPTKFCTYEEFETGVEALKTFCLLRVQSVSGQLDGTIPSTGEGQAEDGSALVDADRLNLSHMGTMGHGRTAPDGTSPAGGSGSPPEDGIPAMDNGNGAGSRPSRGAPQAAVENPQSPGSRTPEDAAPSPGGGALLLAASALVLALGLTAAFQCRRRGARLTPARKGPK